MPQIGLQCPGAIWETNLGVEGSSSLSQNKTQGILAPPIPYSLALLKKGGKIHTRSQGDLE